MARLFVRASSHFLQALTAPATAAPLTLACWFRSSDATVNQDLMALEASAATDGFRLRASGATGGDPITVITTAGTSAVANTTAGYSANTWAHACGVFASASSRTAYLNGGNSATDTNSRTPSGVDRANLGRVWLNNAPTNYLAGDLAEVGIWNLALDAEDVARLALGLSPLLVRPEGLVAYWPLIGATDPEPDWRQARDLTVTGATKADHPRIVYAVSDEAYAFGAAAAAGHPAMRRFGLLGPAFRPLEIGRSGVRIF